VNADKEIVNIKRLLMERNLQTYFFFLSCRSSLSLAVYIMTNCTS